MKNRSNQVERSRYALDIDKWLKRGEISTDTGYNVGRRKAKEKITPISVTQEAAGASAFHFL